jgi:hypothetical protein
MADGTRLYELLARIKPDGSVGLSVRDLVTVGGRDYEGDPRPVSAEDAEVAAFIAEFNAAAAAAAESAVEALAAKDAEIEQLNADKAALQDRIAELEATLNPSDAIWPYEFNALLRPSQRKAVWLSDDENVIDLAVSLLTIVSPMPFGEGSQLRAAVAALGDLLPDVFPPEEVARILDRTLPE